MQFILLIGLSVPPWCFVELMEKNLAMNKSPILQNVRGPDRVFGSNVSFVITYGTYFSRGT